MAGMMGKKIKVLLVDDSAIDRGLWTRILAKAGSVDVAGSASNGKHAFDFLRRNTYDVVISDLRMPVMDGVEFTKRAKEMFPDLKIIVASNFENEADEAHQEALSAGAEQVIHKKDYLSAGIRNGVDVKKLVGELLAGVSVDDRAVKSTRPPVRRPSQMVIPRRPSALVVASSTGGPNALCRVFQEWPARMLAPIMICQHIPWNFVQPLAERIARVSGRECIVPEEGAVVEKSKIYLAPGKRHMEIVAKNPETPVIRLTDDPPENFCRPSADPLFRTASAVYGRNLLGLVLTGLGEDGFVGSGVVVDNGGAVVTQDRESCSVWGMPRAVEEAGLSAKVLPLDQIRTFILGLYDL